MSLLKVEKLSIMYNNSLKYAVDEVDFTVKAGEIIGIIGESGSGKSTLGYAIAGLLPSDAKITHGRIDIAGEDVLNKSISKDFVRMILQDPLTRFCPVFRIRELFLDVLQNTQLKTKTDKIIKAENALINVGMRNPKKILMSYPHELSGGTLQRVMIAIITLCQPKVIIADEPTSAVDAILKNQILLLLKDLSEMDYKPAVVLITHDMDVVAKVCNRVIVMNKGKIIEKGSIEEVLCSPKNQYTKLLCEAAKRFKVEM